MGDREKQLLCEVIDSNFPNDGEYSTAFEKKFSDICDVEYAVAVTSGTVAIFLGLAACGVGPGHEVIIPNVTFIATANAVSLTGARPVLVDVQPEDLCLSAERVERAITSRTKAIVPVHVSGRAARMPELLDVALRHKLSVVEDAAEAIASKNFGSALGSMGDAGCFSFTANKTITTGQGGMVVTNDPAIHQRLRELKDQGRPVRGTGGADTHVSVGYNFKMTNLQGAMGLAQIETLPWRIERLRRTLALYSEHLDNPRVRLVGFDLQSGECPQWIDVIVNGRDELHDWLRNRGVPTRKYWHALHTQAPYRCSDEQFPISTSVDQSGLWLPSSLTLRDEDVKFICSLINGWSGAT